MASEPRENATVGAPPLIEAKLAQPRIRAGVVWRKRLFDALDRLGDVELTVLSGPAGSGKTVLVSSWLADRTDVATAWVTLDAGDDDPVRLWTHVGHAVDRVRNGIGRPALVRLRTPRPKVETAIDELLNGLARYDGRVVIVVDDLHHVRSERSLRSLVYAVERLPPPARMVATTRSDPGRRLGRLRARGALGELRASDLAFTVSETGELLERAGVPVGAKEVELLVSRTEGWPAGVSLAALWLARSDSPRDVIRQFSADHRHVADYLTTEVLDGLDEKTRRFLLGTSIFDRFTATLCDAVLGTDDAARVLADLEYSNLFLVALDSRGAWYRYHHLFRELLRIELRSTTPDAERELHRRAAEWFLANGLVEEGLEHAAAVGDHAELARILTAEHGRLMRGGKSDIFMAWLERLPDEELARNPVIAAAGALAAGMIALPPSRRRRLAAVAEANLQRAGEFEQLYARTLVEMARAGLLDDDLGISLDHATTAVELARRYVGELACPALAILAYLQYLRGDDASARTTAGLALDHPEAPRSPLGVGFAEALLALLECDAGHPLTAEARARDAAGQANELGLSDAWSSALTHHALGRALLALGRAKDAERELERAELLRRAPEPRLDHAHSLLALAAVRTARGRLTLARAELDAAREQLDAFADVGRLGSLAAEVERALDDARSGAEKTVEPPTLAELSILRLLATDLSQREIGDELFVSMNTVKTHTRNIYAKLGVSSRQAAVRQANMLGLLETDDSPG
jgi:ATP/maltotriose-dependent transcriptional regulator MalT